MGQKEMRKFKITLRQTGNTISQNQQDKDKAGTSSEGSL